MTSDMITWRHGNAHAMSVLQKNAPVPNPTMHHFVTEMCTHFCYKMVYCGIFVKCLVGFDRWVINWTLEQTSSLILCKKIHVVRIYIYMYMYIYIYIYYVFIYSRTQSVNWSPPGQMAAISQTTFSNALFLTEILKLRFNFHWNLSLGVQLTINQHWRSDAENVSTWWRHYAPCIPTPISLAL